MSDVTAVAAEALRKGAKIRLHGTAYEVLENESVQRLTLRRLRSNINRTIEHVDRNASVDLAESETPWLMLRPDGLQSGEHVWTVVRMPEETAYGHLNPHADNPDIIVPPRVSEIESKSLRVAWDEVRSGEMDITLPYRIDGDEIGPA